MSLTGVHAALVGRYYDTNTELFYLHFWDHEEIHFGLFTRGRWSADLRGALKRMTAAVISPASIAPGDFVIDAGCGVGGAAADLAAQTGCTVLGLTVSPAQAALARKLARRLRLDGCAQFRTADCSQRLPVPDDSVDVVYSIEAACHFADKDAFIRESARVLKFGGRLAMSDWMAADRMPAADYPRFLAPVCNAWHLAGLDTPARWGARLRAYGFEVRRCVDFGDAVLPNLYFLRRGRLDLLLEEANGCYAPEIITRWKRQLDVLLRAWSARRFTIGRVLAVRRD